MAVAIPAGPRTLAVGNAPTTQTGAGGQWVGAWSLAGVTAVHKADATSAAEAWMAVKYTDIMSTTLAGGDIYKGDLGVSGASSATSTAKQEIDGKEALRFNFTEAAQSLTLNLSSFFSGDDGSGYAEGARIRLYDAGGTLVGETFVRADSASGNQLVQVSSAQAFAAVEISAGARKADGSFSFGGYYNADGSFGTDSYTSGAKHGSDLLVHALSVTLARPAAQSDNYNLDEDAAATGYASVLGNDTDPNGRALTALLDVGPSHGTLVLNADGTFTYQPDADYFGTDSFSYRASNGTDSSDIAVVKLTINAVNDAPVAVNDAATTNEDAATSGNVLANDSDKENDTLAVSNPGTYTTALGATLVLNADGSYSYDPTKSAILQAMPGGTSKVDSFTYNITDNHGGASSAQLNITVQGRDEAGGQVLPSTADGTDLVYYMRYEQHGTSKWLKLDGFSMAVGSEVNTSHGGPVDQGEAVPGNFKLELGSGKALADFTAALLSGDAISSIEIEAYIAGTGKVVQPVQEYRFSDAFVTSSQSTSGNGGATSNTLSFAYGTLHENVSPIADGKATTPQEVRWNVEDGTATLPPGAAIDTGADADTRNLENQVDSTTELEYYVHVDGVTGWVPLSSFSAGYNLPASHGPHAGVGRSSASDLEMGMGLNQVLATLFKNELTGTQASIQVEAYVRTNGTPLLVDEYFFKKALVSGLDSTTDANNTVSLDYGAFTHSHIAYNQAGKVDTSQSSKVGYDFNNESTISVPSANAEALVGARLPGTTAGADLVYYMRYTDNGASKWMLIDGFSLGLNSAISNDRDGSSAGKAIPDAFTLQLGTGKALADFTARLLDGKGISSIEIEAYQGNNGRGAQLVQEFKFTGALVTEVLTSAGDDGATTNTLGFAFKTMHESLTPLDASGKPTVAQDIKWNVEANDTTLPSGAEITAGANADTKNVAPQVSTTTALEYFVHVNGVTGWVALDNFSLGYSAESNYMDGGGSVGRGTTSEVTMDLGLDPVLAALLRNEIGASSATIQVEAYSHQSNGTLQLVDEYFFNNALVSGVASSSNAHNTVDLAYGSFTHSHLAYDSNGKALGADSTKVGYDFTKGVTITAPSANAEASVITAQLPSIAPSSELSYFMRYTQDGVSKWMQLDGFSMSTDSAVGNDGHAISAGNAVPGEFVIDVGTGKVLTDFSKAMLTGHAITNIEIEAYAGIGGGKGQPLVQEFKFTDALVTSVHTSTGADGATLNSLGIAFKTMSESLSPLTKTGQPTTPQLINWNVVDNTSSLPSNAVVDLGADADTKHAAPLVSSGTPLDYYVHVEGVPGWIALSSFSTGIEAESGYTGAGGPRLGEAQASEVTLGMGLSKVLTALFNSEVGGTPVSIQVEAYLPHGTQGKPLLVDEYFFSNAGVSKLSSATDASNEVGLVYTSFTHSHLVYDTVTGKLNQSESSSVGYDFGHAETIGVPAVVADVFH